ncbi:MAG: hypothetical protein QF903_06055 [Planctomycetota bacterium]|jgi:anthranilate phosphoribosyltransferase|nr:hypothetical protein [Planctomycetota bacterium]MDP6763080.1 hypothetical protein [Planctomycetota bacterium]MDP6989023.1 hypothetical protein [Planctomycetota bacterium]
MSLRDLLKHVAPGRNDVRHLTFDECREAMDACLSGSEDEVTVGAFWVALRAKGATVEELRGFASAARARANLPCENVGGLVWISPPLGGYESNPPLEVAAGLVAAGAGASVMICTDRCVPPKRGLTASSVLEGLGLSMTWDPAEAESWVEQTRFAVCSVSGMLPELLALRRVRDEIAVRTPLSTVEKLISPPSASVMAGTQSGPVLGIAVEVLQELGHKRALAVQGMEGGVVPSVRRKTRAIELSEGYLISVHVEPEDFGLECDGEPELPLFSPPPEGKGQGDNEALVRAAAEMTALVLAGEPSPARSATLIAGALILKAAGRCMTLAEGVDAATISLDTGKAREALERLRELSG